MLTLEDIFHSVVAKDIKNSLLPNASDFPNLLKRFGTYCNTVATVSGSEARSPWQQTQFQQPKTAHYQDHFYDPYTLPADGITRTVELARFPVPVGQIGLVRKINQWVNDDYTESDNWGSPVTNAWPDNLTWYLRLSNYQALGNREIIQSTRIPGIPYPDLPQWTLLWFLPHAPANDVNLVVPGGYILRFFVNMPGTQERDEMVLGRLVGYWQSSEVSSAAGFNAAKGW